MAVSSPPPRRPVPSRPVRPTTPVTPPPPAKVTDPSSGLVTRYAGLDIQPVASIGTGYTLGWYGDKGGGKTTLGASQIFYLMQRDPNARQLVLDIEGGTRSIKSWPNTDRVKIESWIQFVKLVEELTLDTQCPWKGISVDNLTELSDLSMDVVLRQAHKQEPEWPEWRLNSRVVVHEIRKLRDLAQKRSLIVQALVWNREDVDAKGNVRRVGVDLNPKLAGLFAGAVDIVGWIEPVGEGRERMRALHLGPTSRISAKFRQDQFDPAARGIPLDIYYRLSPEDKGPMIPLLEALVEGKEWPKNKYAAPEGVRTQFSQRPQQERRDARRSQGGTSNSPVEEDSEGAESEATTE